MEKQTRPQNEVKAEQAELTSEQRVEAARINAVNQAIAELMHNNRTAIVRRAAELLRKSGYTVTEVDMGLDENSK